MVIRGSAWGKNNRRGLFKTLGRFLAILAIVALGVGFFTGLRLARPAMAKTGADYLRETNFFDFELRSTLGFTGEDVAYFAGLDGIAAAEGSLNEDLLTTCREQQVVFSTHQLLDEINQVVLSAGRMPQAANECLGDDRFFTEADLGTVFQVENDDEDAAFSQQSYTLVGLCNSPQYLNSQRGSTALGDGSVAAFLFLPAAGYDAAYYSAIYVKLDENADAFTDAYEARSDQWETPLKDQVALRGALRQAELISDAEAELSDGWAEYEDGLQEYEDGKLEAEQELSDGKQELSDALQELQDGEADYAEGVETLEALREDPLSNEELADARQELDDGWAAYYDGLREYNDGLQEYEDAVAENQPKLDDAKVELDKAKQELDDGEAEYAEGLETYEKLVENPLSNEEMAEARRELDIGWSQYREGLAQYEAGLAEYEAGKAQLDAYGAQLEDERTELEQAEASGALTGEALEAAWAQYNSAYEAYQTQVEAAEAAKAELDASKAQLDEAYATLQRGEAAYDEGYQVAVERGKEELDKARQELDDGWKEYNEGLQAYNDGVKELADAKQELADGKQELDDAYADLTQGEADYKSGYEDALAEGEQELADARKELDDGWAEYKDGLKDYEEGKLEAEQELADAKQELDDALVELQDGEAELDNLRDPSYYALPRTTNTGYANFDSDTSIVEGLAAIFPVFFFLVAALVCSSTMTRMVEEQRTENGTLKALGYSDQKIVGRYIFYAGLAAVSGSLLGFGLGSWLFPLVIWHAYQIIYRFGEITYVFDPVLGLVSLAVALLCSVGAALAAAYSEMRKMPAILMRPKAPKAGKRIFLERVTVLWRRMSFLQKVSARNVFRYKKRLVMMLLGVGGCLALLLAGLGLRDSVANVAEDQYSAITLYDYTITFDQDQTAEQQETFREETAQDLSHLAFAAVETVDVFTQNGVSSVSVVASDDADITSLFGLSHNGRSVAWPEGDGAVVSDKLLRLAGISVGDSLTVELGDGTVVEIPVTGVFENYVNHYILLTGRGFETYMGKAPAYSTAYASTESEAVSAVAARLNQRSHVSNVSLSRDFQNMIADTMESLNAVIALVVGCALALSFVVSYNLININITERVREIATIKVLGFYQWETYSYVFREGLILTCLGRVAGIPVGIWLHRFVMERIQVDMVSFRVRISPWSYLLALALTILITLVADALVMRKIDKIDMAESLKSVE